MPEKVLKEEERIALDLRSLYKKYGYLPYKMSKFEEYDLYVANKEFLISDGVITFNDTDGKLLALKPDVTLSIIRNSVDSGMKRKVYYDENVYRISAKTKQFKEIKQVGLECIGDIDLYDIFESVCLAANSLSLISKKFVLDISHLGILSGILNGISQDVNFQKEAMHALAEKNPHGLADICDKYGVSEADKEKLTTFIFAYGAPEQVLKTIAPFCKKGEAKEAFQQLRDLCKLLSVTAFAEYIRLDFSVINDMNYYNGIVFKGFIDGVAEGVLSGGRYDKLMQRMGKVSGAIGFAVYTDLLESFQSQKREKDVDILLLYDEKTPVLALSRAVEALVKKGNSVSAQKSKDGLRYGELVDMRGR